MIVERDDSVLSNACRFCKTNLHDTNSVINWHTITSDESNSGTLKRETETEAQHQLKVDSRRYISYQGFKE